MLRQLARLTVPVESAGERACAIAVYADAADRTIPAAERGYEGVACVDDASRALVLLSDVWSATAAGTRTTTSTSRLCASIIALTEITSALKTSCAFCGECSET